MQTALPENFIATSRGQRAEEILRACVHCGFCNATCPTYQLLGDELDGPRGRIYLIKEMLEQEQVDTVGEQHLDRCLTCRACETTCPSGVAYGELLEIGRDYLEAHHQRGWFDRIRRSWLKRVVPYPRRFSRWARLGALARPVLSKRLARQLPPLIRPAKIAAPAVAPVRTAASVGNKVLLLDGCVQRVSTPEVNAQLAALLASRGIEVIRAPDEGCCGGLALHLGDEQGALAAIRRNLDALAPYLDDVDAIISTASGCGVTLKDYQRLLGADDDHAALARACVEKLSDAGEYLLQLGGVWGRLDDRSRVSLHVPCTLQHGQRRGGDPAVLLTTAGYELLEVKDAHLCCGSAGTYALLQPDIAEQLGRRKVAHLEAGAPDVIATANVGCQVHLAGQSETPVVHWLTLLTAATEGAAGEL